MARNVCTEEMKESQVWQANFASHRVDLRNEIGDSVSRSITHWIFLPHLTVFNGDTKKGS